MMLFVSLCPYVLRCSWTHSQYHRYANNSQIYISSYMFQINNSQLPRGHIQISVPPPLRGQHVPNQQISCYSRPEHLTSHPLLSLFFTLHIQSAAAAAAEVLLCNGFRFPPYIFMSPFTPLRALLTVT